MKSLLPKFGGLLTGVGAIILTAVALASGPKTLLAQQNCGNSSDSYCQCNNFPPGQVCSAHMTCTWGGPSSCSLSCQYYDCFTP